MTMEQCDGDSHYIETRQLMYLMVGNIAHYALQILV